MKPSVLRLTQASNHHGSAPSSLAHPGVGLGIPGTASSNSQGLHTSMNPGHQSNIPNQVRNIVFFILWITFSTL